MGKFSEFVFCYECGHAVRQDKVSFHCYEPSCAHQVSFAQLRSTGQFRRQGDLLRVRCPEDDIPLRPVCPRGHDMAMTYIAPDSTHLAIIGPRFSGKSTFFTGLYHYLDNHDAGLTVTIWPQAKHTWFINNWYNPYLAGEELPKTTRATEFCMEVRPKEGFLDRGLFFTFYDAPGDWFWDAEEMMIHAQYLRSATGVVFIFDPYSIPGMRQGQSHDGRLLPDIDPMLEQEISRYDVTAALNCLVEFHRRAGQKVRKKMPVRLSVVMNKADLLMSETPMGDCLVDADGDRRALCRVNRRTRRLFEQLDCDMLADALDRPSGSKKRSLRGALQMAEEHFASVGCFVSTSLQPDSEDLKPQGVVNPLMWGLGIAPTWLHALLGLA